MIGNHMCTARRLVAYRIARLEACLSQDLGIHQEPTPVHQLLARSNPERTFVVRATLCRAIPRVLHLGHGRGGDAAVDPRGGDHGRSGHLRQRSQIYRGSDKGKILLCANANYCLWLGTNPEILSCMQTPRLSFLVDCMPMTMPSNVTW